jgi:hypothetical protein
VFLTHFQAKRDLSKLSAASQIQIETEGRRGSEGWKKI